MCGGGRGRALFRLFRVCRVMNVTLFSYYSLGCVAYDEAYTYTWEKVVLARVRVCVCAFCFITSMYLYSTSFKLFVFCCFVFVAVETAVAFENRSGTLWLQHFVCVCPHKDLFVYFGMCFYFCLFPA